jgi:AcrR family transcriptional regulator
VGLWLKKINKSSVLSVVSVVNNTLSKKQTILKTAARLFAAQGFDGTTTMQIAREAGVTEPLIYYHFKGKDNLFTSIIENGFAEYLARIDALEKKPDSPFGQIQKLIELQYNMTQEMPDQVQLIASVCPARLNDPWISVSATSKNTADV